MERAEKLFLHEKRPNGVLGLKARFDNNNNSQEFIITQALQRKKIFYSVNMSAAVCTHVDKPNR